MGRLTAPTLPAVSASPGVLRIAAIDIGSNSVHMIVAQVDGDGGVTTLWRVKEMVGLGRISFHAKRLSTEAMDRVTASLARMKQAAQQRQAEKIVAVATSAIREADNGGDLIDRIKRDLKLYVKVVSAREEARLIYLGVCSTRELGDEPKLIIDIGGGSVEFIVGTATEAKMLESRKLGAARMTAQFVQSDPISKDDLARLRAHYTQELAPIVSRVKTLSPAAFIGTSGTLETIAQMCGSESSDGRPVIEAKRLSKLYDRVIGSTADERRRLRGLDDQRKDQIVAGVVLVHELMTQLGIRQIGICGAALREGILHEYLARRVPELEIRKEIPDPRRREVLDLARRCNWAESHSTQVAMLTVRLFDQLHSVHGLGPRARELIEYGALLHDIGWHISPSRHHKHGEYLIRNGNLKTFTASEIETMANIVRFHRKSPPNRRKHARFARLSPDDRKIVEYGVALLRIADGLDRSHAGSVREVTCVVGKKSASIRVLSQLDAQLELWSARQKKSMLEKLLDKELEIVEVRPHVAKNARAIAAR
jgi:exopolyphosphatase/guanosine-5'-triphosphate,3'-diphosphate pyrophosphatase